MTDSQSNDDRAIRVAERFRLDGKRVLVTGAGRGLGAACAEASAEAGADLILMRRSNGPLDALKAKIESAGFSGTVETLVQDVTDLEGAMAAIRSLGPLDGLLNNAGSNIPEPFQDVSIAHFDQLFDLNVRSCFFVAQAVARGMIDGGVKGSIVHMSSQMGHVGAPNRSVYCASKHAIEGLTKAMAGTSARLEFG